MPDVVPPQTGSALRTSANVPAATEEPLSRPTAPAAPTTKKCPYCRSEIAIEATRCPHCTSVLDVIGEEQPKP